MSKKGFTPKAILYGVLFFLVGACNLTQIKNHTPESNATESLSVSEVDTIQSVSIEDSDTTESITSPVQQRRQIVEIGTGKFISSPSQTDNKYQTNHEGDITLNFQSTDINEFVKVVLGDLLNKNFIIDPKVRGKVTIETGRPLSKTELLPLLDKILAINNAAIIDTGDVYKIIPRGQAIQGNLSPADSAIVNNRPGYSVRIIPLEFIAAQEMQKILEPFINQEGEVRVDKQRNMLILAGTTAELKTLQDTIDIFDVDWLRGMSVGLYPLEHVAPDALKVELDAILGSVAAGAENSAEGELLGGILRIVPIERLNSLLLISSTVSALREAELWVYRLDRPGEGIGQQLYVYDVQNAKATELADILGHIFGGGSFSSGASAALAPGTSPVELSGNDPVDNNAGSSSNSSQSVGNSDVSLASGDPVKIIADDTRNALIILATSKDYKMIAAAIRKLDIVPLQVLIEASILEVTLTDDLNYGVEWFFKNKLNNTNSGQGQLDLGDTGLSALSPGFSYSIINNASNVRIALNALQSESEINVLSSPSLMVLDNQTASINVGDEIPVPSRQSISNVNPSAPSVNEIQFRNTGITLTVTPRVNSSGLVTMDIKQEVSNAVPTTSSSIDAPTIQQRQIESTVAINSGQTIVLGGLILDSNTDNQSGIPLLSKIPFIGKLFSQTNNSFRRTELIVLITPRVVRNNNDARKITDEFRRKLRGLPSS